MTHPVTDWHRRIEELSDIWLSAKIACVCLRVGDQWLNLVGKAELSAEAPKPQRKPRVLCDDLLVIEGSFDINKLSHLIQNLLKGEIFEAGAGTGTLSPVRLSIDETKPGTWYPLTVFERYNAERTWGVDFKTIIADYSGPSWQEVMSYVQRDSIDEKLRSSAEPFDGISGLARSLKLTGLNTQTNGGTGFQLRAPIVVKFKSVLRNLQDKTLKVTVQAAETVRLSDVRVSAIHMSNESSESLGTLETWEQIDNGSAKLFQQTRTIEPFCGSLKLILSLKNMLADAQIQYLSSANIWTRACEFFDPDLVKSEELRNKLSKISVSALEMGALRFFSALGFRTAWFGKNAAERKPDILVYYEYDDGGKALLVVDCTEENPSAKLTKISSTVESMRGFLGDNVCSLTPVIFIPHKVVEADRKQATSHSVALIGSEESNKVWEGCKNGTDLEKIVQYVQDLARMLS